MNTIHVIARRVGLESRTINFKDLKLDCPFKIGSHTITYSSVYRVDDNLSEEASAFVNITGSFDSYSLNIGNGGSDAWTKLAEYEEDVSEPELVRDLDKAIALRNVINAVWDTFDKKMKIKIGDAVFSIWEEDEDYRTLCIGKDDNSAIFFKIIKGSTTVNIWRKQIHDKDIVRNIKIVSVEQVLKNILGFVRTYPILSNASTTIALYVTSKGESKPVCTDVIPKSAQQAFISKFKELVSEFKNAK